MADTAADRARRSREWRQRNPEKMRLMNAKARQEPNYPERAKLYAEKYRLDGRRKIIKRRHLLQRYGLTYEDFETMLVGQHDKCRICLKTFDPKRTPAVDHDHITGKVRGLLCSRCNTGIGLLAEDPFILSRVWAYLRHHEAFAHDAWEAVSHVDLPAPAAQKLRGTQE